MLVYAAGVLALRWGLHHLPRETNPAQPKVSIVVAARNEAAVLDDCLHALTIQDYPAEQLEIIIVDDRSTDGTA
ncbi:glycosyltransferase, partial [bacterium]|nr:glycosyltransferase [bacterium]